MSYKKRHPLRLPIILTIITVISLFLLVIAGMSLSKNQLLLINASGETQIEITDAGEYYVLVDTGGTRFHTVLETIGVANSMSVIDDDEKELYEVALVAKGESADTGETFTDVEFDKQVKKKDYISFATVDLEEDTYLFTSNVITESDDFGGFALLSLAYVARIGLFSLAAITTLLFGLLAFKQFRKVQQIPISKYQKKHLKK